MNSKCSSAPSIVSIVRYSACEIAYHKWDYSGGVRSSAGCRNSAGIVGWRVPALCRGTATV